MSTSGPVTSRPGQDTSRPLEERVESLLAEMSLEEKVGQLGSRWVGMHIEGALAEPAPDAVEDPDFHVVAGRRLVTPVDCRPVGRA